MFIKIVHAMGEFQQYLLDNIGSPIGLETVGAFSRMMVKIVDAVVENGG